MYKCVIFKHIWKSINQLNTFKKYYLIICVMYYLKMKHTNYRNSVMWSQKRILTLLFNLEKKIGTGKEESEMSKFSADGKYSGDRQGDKRKHGQLVGVAAGSCHSPRGLWKWAFWVERVSPINPFDTSSVPTTGLLASYFVPNSRILHRTRGLKAYVFYDLRQKQLSNSSNISQMAVKLI